MVVNIYPPLADSPSFMNSIEKIARILNTTPEALRDLDTKMAVVTGKQGVIDKIVKQNDETVDHVLEDLGLTRQSTAEEIYDALTGKLIEIDKRLFELLGKPDLSKLSTDSNEIGDVALSIFTPPPGLFIKKEKVSELLAKQPPQSLLDHFGYQNVEELLEKEGFASVVAALRFTQTSEWMRQFFDVAYAGLKPEDFENRDVEMKVLDTKWLEIAQKFMGKKFHNVSHLKEFGIIFISPDPIDMPGETLRMFILLLHYFHEVPFYSGLFRKFLNDSDFVAKFQSLLRGDVLEIQEARNKNQEARTWLIIQRYLAKNDIHDPRLAMHHVSPEAEHWYRVANNFGKLAEVMSTEGRSPAGGGHSASGGEDKFNISYWTELDNVGDFFKNRDGADTLVSFDVVDLVMSLVKSGEVKYLYHQQEALWNTIFAEYLGRDKMNQLTEENIIKGFIEL